MKHTTACIKARGGAESWSQLPPFHKVSHEDGTVSVETDPAAEAIFACPHPTYYAYRFIWGRAPEHRSGSPTHP